MSCLFQHAFAGWHGFAPNLGAKLIEFPLSQVMALGKVMHWSEPWGHQQLPPTGQVRVSASMLTKSR